MDDNKVVNLRSREQLKTEQRIAKKMLWLMPENVRNSLIEQQPQSLKGKEVRVKRLMYFLFFSLFLLPAAVLGILLLYLIKSAIGIDIFPGFSFGLWGWFKAYI